MNPLGTLFAALLLTPLAILPAVAAPAPVDLMPEFRTTLQRTLTRHLDTLVTDDGSIARMKGKTSEGNGALAFY